MTAQEFTGASPDWDDLRYLLALARRGTLSAAARLLRVNHATVARRVAELEALLGTPLVERRASAYALTPAGEAALAVALRMEAAMAALTPALAGPAAGLHGTVRLSLTEELALSRVVPGLGELAARHPGLTLELLVDNRSLSLARREADLALRWAQPRDGHILARFLADVPFRLLAAPAYLARRGGPADTTPHAIVTYVEEWAHLPEALALRAHLPEARVALRANSAGAVRLGVQAGLGVGMLPAYMAGAGLVPLPGVVEPGLTRPLWLLRPLELKDHPAVSAVAVWLAELLGGGSEDDE